MEGVTKQDLATALGEAETKIIQHNDARVGQAIEEICEEIIILTGIVSDDFECVHQRFDQVEQIIHRREGSG